MKNSDILFIEENPLSEKRNALTSIQNTYSIKEIKKDYGRKANDFVQDTLRFACLREWEDSAPEIKIAISDEKYIRYQIDFEFKEAYKYLMKALSMANLTFDVFIYSHILEEGRRADCRFERLAPFVRIINDKTKRALNLGNVQMIEHFCIWVLFLNALSSWSRIFGRAFLWVKDRTLYNFLFSTQAQEYDFLISNTSVKKIK